MLPFFAKKVHVLFPSSLISIKTGRCPFAHPNSIQQILHFSTFSRGQALMVRERMLRVADVVFSSTAKTSGN